MKNNEEMIVYTAGQFKSKALNTACQQIVKIAENEAKNRKQLAVILWRLEKTKAYKEDNFNSIEEFAASIGMNKSKAHKLADAGKMYDNEDEEVKQLCANLDYSKAAMLASEKTEDVKEAFQNDEISTESTQSDITAWKNRNKTEGKKESVLSKYHVNLNRTSGHVVESFEYESIELELIKELDGFEKVGKYIRKDEKGNKIGGEYTLLFNPATLEVAYYSASKVKEQKKAKKQDWHNKTIAEMTKEERLAYIAELEAANREE